MAHKRQVFPAFPALSLCRFINSPIVYVKIYQSMVSETHEWWRVLMKTELIKVFWYWDPWFDNTKNIIDLPSILRSICHRNVDLKKKHYE